MFLIEFDSDADWKLRDVQMRRVVIIGTGKLETETNDSYFRVPKYHEQGGAVLYPNNHPIVIIEIF